MSGTKRLRMMTCESAGADCQDDADSGALPLKKPRTGDATATMTTTATRPVPGQNPAHPASGYNGINGNSKLVCEMCEEESAARGFRIAVMRTREIMAVCAECHLALSETASKKAGCVLPEGHMRLALETWEPYVAHK